MTFCLDRGLWAERVVVKAFGARRVHSGYRTGDEASYG